MEGAKVYVQDPSSGWQKATVTAALGGGRYVVEPEAWEDERDVVLAKVEVDASKMEDGTLPFQNAGMPEAGFPDMTALDHLHEAALLHNLRVRFFAGSCPYTYTADIVIAVNPYRWFPDLYTDQKRKEYLVFDRSKLAPHAYATSSAAYSDLQESKVNQAILVSGESGAGKTETVKILMAHLAMIASSDDQSHIRRIVESNPLLESFGNAQTVRNDNSSRFGKFIELELNGTCRLAGSKCRTYLLEKSRVVSQDKGERNYHIFYQMLAADLGLRESVGLQNIAKTRDTARYTRMGGSTTETIEGKSDGDRFKITVDALALVGVVDDLLKQLLRAIAGVLLLGELDFSGGAGADDRASLAEGAQDEATDIAAALEVDVKALTWALTHRSIKTLKETFVKPLAAPVASAARDALAKELYSRIFDWLVVQICAATSATAGQMEHFIGLLDIFGFESFVINRFEQLCINYANEKLQQKFTLDVFKSVQQEYSDEGIPWDRIEFKDNAPLLSLIESKLGIIAMLNEECVRPKGSDENFVSKLKTVHKEDQAFSTPKLGAQRELQFTIRHYAGSVTYTTSGWLERNKDTISDDLITLMRTSSNPLIAGVFAADDAAEKADARKGDTLATKFKSSLTQLMETIGRTTTQYVRCIKPNKNKSPTEVDNVMVVEQLRCAGVIEAIRISRAGFPARMPLAEFVVRFGMLARVVAGIGFAHGRAVVQSSDAGVASLAASAIQAVWSKADAAATCRALMVTLVPAGKDQYEIGRTRVYFKSGVLEELEERRALLLQAAAVRLGCWARCCQQRARYRLLRRSTLRMQATRRMRDERAGYLVQRGATIQIQAIRRGVVARRFATTLHRERFATRLQAFQRRRVAVREFARSRRAAVRIQSAARRRACRKKYIIDLAEFKEQAKLENQVRLLKAKLEAQEARYASGTRTPSTSTEPPLEILEALQALAAENAKLRVELERQRNENVELRRENQKLRAGDSTRSYWLASMLNTSRRQPAADDRAADHKDSVVIRRAHQERHTGFDRSVSSGEAIASSDADPITSSASASPAMGEDRTRGVDLRLYPPLSDFWEDVPCSGVPLLRSGSEAHIKLGPNILSVDGKGRGLNWQHWMPSSGGYRRSMAFILERRAERQSGSQRIPSDEVPDDGSLGIVFALRSALTGKYVVEGGMLDWYRMQVNGERPEDAAVFTLVPLMPNEGAPHKDSAELARAAAHTFVLRLSGEDKLLSIQKNGYVKMVSVPDLDTGIDNDTMAMAFECLQITSSYEIVFHGKQIGIKVGQELPLHVSGFTAMQCAQGLPETGPAESSGRVHIGDIIKSVNGQDLGGVSRSDALAMIANSRRPVVLAFEVVDSLAR